MALPTNDDFANRELSIEELEAIAAGWPKWVHSAVHGAEAVVHALEGPAKEAVSIAGTVYGAYNAYKGASWIISAIF